MAYPIIAEFLISKIVVNSNVIYVFDGFRHIIYKCNISSNIIESLIDMSNKYFSRNFLNQDIFSNLSVILDRILYKYDFDNFRDKLLKLIITLAKESETYSNIKIVFSLLYILKSICNSKNINLDISDEDLSILTELFPFSNNETTEDSEIMEIVQIYIKTISMFENKNIEILEYACAHINAENIYERVDSFALIQSVLTYLKIDIIKDSSKYERFCRMILLLIDSLINPFIEMISITISNISLKDNQIRLIVLQKLFSAINKLSLISEFSDSFRKNLSNLRFTYDSESFLALLIFLPIFEIFDSNSYNNHKSNILTFLKDSKIPPDSKSYELFRGVLELNIFDDKIIDIFPKFLDFNNPDLMNIIFSQFGSKINNSTIIEYLKFLKLKNSQSKLNEIFKFFSENKIFNLINEICFKNFDEYYIILFLELTDYYIENFKMTKIFSKFVNFLKLINLSQFSHLVKISKIDQKFYFYISILISNILQKLYNFYIEIKKEIFDLDFGVQIFLPVDFKLIFNNLNLEDEKINDQKNEDLRMYTPDCNDDSLNLILLILPVVKFVPPMKILDIVQIINKKFSYINIDFLNSVLVKFLNNFDYNFNEILNLYIKDNNFSILFLMIIIRSMFIKNIDYLKSQKILEYINILKLRTDYDTHFLIYLIPDYEDKPPIVSDSCFSITLQLISLKLIPMISSILELSKFEKDGNRYKVFMDIITKLNRNLLNSNITLNYPQVFYS